MSKFLKILISIGIIILLGAGIFVFIREPENNFANEAKDLQIGEIIKNEDIDSKGENGDKGKVIEEGESGGKGGKTMSGDSGDKTLPEKIFIKVPFTSQAPFAAWDEKHKEACEEASLAMLKYYLDKKPLTPEIADREILRMIDFEIKNLGHFEDSNATEMAKIAAEFYGIENTKIIYDFEKSDIKKYLAGGKPIIVPAAGRLLGNPNYKQPGPLYHALILVGYEGDTIIANDPGTRRGESYRYNLNILYNAIHDFPGQKEEIEKGRKAMIVLE